MTRPVQLLAAETRRYLSELRTYYPDLITQLITTAVVFIIFFFLQGGTSTPGAWFGYLLWLLASLVISEAPVSLNSEKVAGTLAQLQIKPVGLVPLMAAKTTVWTAVNLVPSTLTITALCLAFRINVAFSPWLIPIGAITLVGLFGFTLVLVGFTLLYSKVSGLVGIMSYLLLLLTGAIVPLSALPPALGALGSAMPLTLGISLGRGVLDGQPLDPWSLGALTAQSACYLAAGYVVFRLVMRRSARRGISYRY